MSQKSFAHEEKETIPMRGEPIRVIDARQSEGRSQAPVWVDVNTGVMTLVDFEDHSLVRLSLLAARPRFWHSNPEQDGWYVLSENQSMVPSFWTYQVTLGELVDKILAQRTHQFNVPMVLVLLDSAGPGENPAKVKLFDARHG